MWRGGLYAMGWRQEGGVVTDMPGRPKATTYTFEMWRLALTNTGAGWETAPLAWEKVLMTGTAPTPRDNFSQCLIGDRWLVHGGNDVFRELKNDTYQFDFHTAAWAVVRIVVFSEPRRPGLLPLGARGVALGWRSWG